MSETKKDILDWAKENSFEAVVWTDLHSNFNKVTGKDFSIDNAIKYIIEDLKKKKPEGYNAAQVYIENAPEEIVTKLRRELINFP